VNLKFSDPRNITPIPQSQDELRERFVSKGLAEKLIAVFECVVADPYNAGFDHWERTVICRREEYRDRQTHRRVALIYWIPNETTGDPEPTIMSLIDGGARYKWNYVTAAKEWSQYKRSALYDGCGMKTGCCSVGGGR
jgi:hypothetical protein